MREKLYIVSTYYHALIACVKQLHNPCCRADIAVTAYIPEYEQLAERIRESSVFSEVLTVQPIQEYIPRNRLDMIFSLHRKNAALIEKQLTFQLNGYACIELFHDDTWAAHYCKDKLIRYTLDEDGLNTFSTISSSPFAFMTPKPGLKQWLKEKLRIGYVFCGADRCTTVVEVNSAEGLELNGVKKEKIRVVPRGDLFGSLTGADREKLRRIFMQDLPYLADGAAVMLTQPLYADGLVPSLDMQISVYKALAEKYIPVGSPLVIKPHPRDDADYSSAFPGSSIMPKNMPVEILELCGGGSFSAAFTISSSSISMVDAPRRMTVDLNELLSDISKGSNNV